MATEAEFLQERLLEVFREVAADIPCPEPLAEAVEALLFGFDDRGSPCPDAEQVREITSEHARELCFIQLEIHWLESCVVTGQHPESGKQPQSAERADANRQHAQKALHECKLDFLGGMAAYEQHFGHEGELALKAFVERVMEQVLFEVEPPSVQKELF